MTAQEVTARRKAMSLAERLARHEDCLSSGGCEAFLQPLTDGPGSHEYCGNCLTLVVDGILQDPLSSGGGLSLALTSIVADAAARMLAISDADAGQPVAAGKWSRKEIVGHLVDSAVNNQGRFVRAQLKDDLVFDGYDQEAWVRVQGYGERPWLELVSLWRAYNQQLAATVRATTASELDRPRARHNLDTIGFRPLPAGTSPTLGFLMRDYVAHLEHHVQQVLPVRSLG
jgi:hypothetical protein